MAKLSLHGKVVKIKMPQLDENALQSLQLLFRISTTERTTET